MRLLFCVALAGAFAVGGVREVRAEQPADPGGHEAAMAKSAAATYERLATAIIELNATEDELVKSILVGYETAAQRHLRAAGFNAERRGTHLEAAAAQVANIANEGDKSIQAVRQRLAKAGHTHHTDAETKEDYIWVDGKEKKALLELAAKIAKADKDADLSALAAELAKTFEAAVKPE